MSAQASIPAVRTLVIPKVDHEDHLDHIEQGISRAIQRNHELLDQRPGPLSVVASIESAQALWRIGEIARWESKFAHLSALLVRMNLPSIALSDDSHSLQFAAEDCARDFISPPPHGSINTFIIDCADTRIVRTPSRQELLYTRSKIVVAARAFGLDAIDMVSCLSEL